MTKENEFIKTFEEWYEWWFNKPFPTDKEEAEELKADFTLRNLYEHCCKRKISVGEEVENAIKQQEENDKQQKEKLELLVKFNKLVNDTFTNKDEIYEHYNVEDNSQMTNEQLKDAIKIMEKKVKK